MHAEPFHEAEGARYRTIRHNPHRHVNGFGSQRNEIPEVIVCRLRLRKTAIRLLFRGMNKIRKLDRILNEENRDVIPYQVPVAFLGIELDRETSHIAREVRGTLVACDGRESHEQRSLLSSALKEVGPRKVGQRFVILEVAMSTETTRMHDALGNSLVVEVENLFAEVGVLQCGRTPHPNLQRVLVVGDRNSLLGSEPRNVAGGYLMGLASATSFDGLVAQMRDLAMVVGTFVAHGK